MKNYSHKVLTGFAWSVFLSGLGLFLLGLILRASHSGADDLITESFGGGGYRELGSVLISAGWQVLLIAGIVCAVNLAVSALHDYRRPETRPAPVQQAPAPQQR